MRRLLGRKTLVRTAVVAGTLAASAGVLFLLVYRERDILLQYDWQLHWHFLALSLPVFGAGLALAALVWADLMRSLGSTVSFSRHFYYYCVANVAKRLPGTLWYVAGRGYLYKQDGESLRLVSIASGVELVVSVVAGIIVTIGAAFLQSAVLPDNSLLGLVSALCIGLLLTHPRIIRWSLERAGVPDVPQLRYTDIVRWVAGYAGIWLLGGALLYLIAAAVVPMELHTLPYVVLSWSLVGVVSVLVFFLPSNVGITEAGLSLLLTSIMSSSFAVLIAILTRLLLIAYEALGALVVFLIERRGLRNTRPAGIFGENNSKDGINMP